MPDTTWSLPLTIEHAVDVPALNDSAPVPEPPLVVIVASASPNVAEAGPVMVRVAWLALALTMSVNVADGEFAAPPWHAPPGGCVSTPLTWNVYVPAGVDAVVVMLNVVDTFAPFVRTGLTPKFGVAVACSPVFGGVPEMMLSVVSHEPAFPPACTVTDPKFAVPP